jgi:hypothetical protein
MIKPLLLRRAVIQKVAQTVSRGVPLKHAALVAGITPNQLTRWMKTGAKMRAIVAEEGHFPRDSTQEDWMTAELHQEVELAHAKVVERYAKRINTAAKKSWQACAWWLQRRAKDEFSTVSEGTDAEKKPSEEKEQFVFHCPENGRG